MEEKKANIKQMTWTSETLAVLMRQFDCSETCVQNALRFRTNSPLSRLIRREAVKLGSFVEYVTILRRPATEDEL